MEWILCPECRGKTRTQIREDTVLENFPLFCPKCKQTFLISVRNRSIQYLEKPDAETQSCSFLFEVWEAAGWAFFPTA